MCDVTVIVCLFRKYLLHFEIGVDKTFGEKSYLRVCNCCLCIQHSNLVVLFSVDTQKPMENVISECTDCLSLRSNASCVTLPHLPHNHSRNFVNTIQLNQLFYESAAVKITSSICFDVKQINIPKFCSNLSFLSVHISLITHFDNPFCLLCSTRFGGYTTIIRSCWLLLSSLAFLQCRLYHFWRYLVVY